MTILTDTWGDRKKVCQDLMKYNFTKTKDEDVDIDNDYICLLKGVHKRLLHLFVQNKSLDEIMKDKTIIKFIWRQFGHYKYYHNKVLKTLNNKKLFENELNAIFKFIRNYIDEYNNEKNQLKKCYKRNSTIVKHLSYDFHFIPDTKLETRYYRDEDKWLSNYFSEY
jgi:hypothetical protein|tara:strand:+ start:61 stop:558 length:498 start_codon:yes stop_codon:yes gene_type:complete